MKEVTVTINGRSIPLYLGNNNLVVGAGVPDGYGTDFTAVYDAARVGHPNLTRVVGSAGTYGSVSVFYKE